MAAALAAALGIGMVVAIADIRIIGAVMMIVPAGADIRILTSGWICD